MNNLPLQSSQPVLNAFYTPTLLRTASPVQSEKAMPVVADGFQSGSLIVAASLPRLGVWTPGNRETLEASLADTSPQANDATSHLVAHAQLDKVRPTYFAARSEESLSFHETFGKDVALAVKYFSAGDAASHAKGQATLDKYRPEFFAQPEGNLPQPTFGTTSAAPLFVDSDVTSHLIGHALLDQLQPNYFK